MRSFPLLGRRRRGQSVLELTMILPVFLIICFFMITIGMLLYSKMLVVISASQGARVGAQIWREATLTDLQKQEKIETVVLGVLSSGISKEKVHYQTEELEGALVVTVTYDFDLILPLLAGIFKEPSLKLEHKAVYYIEGS